MEEFGGQVTANSGSLRWPAVVAVRTLTAGPIEESSIGEMRRPPPKGEPSMDAATIGIRRLAKQCSPPGRNWGSDARTQQGWRR